MTFVNESTGEFEGCVIRQHWPENLLVHVQALLFITGIYNWALVLWSLWCILFISDFFCLQCASLMVNTMTSYYFLLVSTFFPSFLNQIFHRPFWISPPPPPPQFPQPRSVPGSGLRGGFVTLLCSVFVVVNSVFFVSLETYGRCWLSCRVPSRSSSYCIWGIILVSSSKTV